MGNIIFSKQIKRVRLNANLTMEQLAEKLGVTKSSVSMWENRGVVPREEVLRKIANLFQVSLDTLLGVSPEEVENPKLEYLRRNLGKLDEKRLKQAENVLKAVFEDIFIGDGDSHDSDI